MDLVTRARITQKTLDQFLNRKFEWGKIDCAHLAHFHITEAGGTTNLIKVRYSTALGAKRSLKKLGFQTLDQALDRHLPQIAPANALIGDLVGLDSDDTTMCALGLYLGGGRVLAFADPDNLGPRALMGPLEAVSQAWKLEVA